MAGISSDEMRRQAIPMVTVSTVALCGALGCGRFWPRGLQVKGLEGWLAKEVPRLQAFVPTPETVALAMQQSPKHITVEAFEGLIRFPNDEWIYFTCFSTHTKKPDLVLAIDHTGAFYACNDHVCPTLVLSRTTKQPVDSVAAFLTTQGSDKRSKPCRWYPLPARFLKPAPR